MAIVPESVDGTHSSWRRIVLWFERWAEAIDFNISEDHERRIARLELEVEALHSQSAASSDGTSSQQLADKEVS